jgi:hypothetical protein
MRSILSVYAVEIVALSSLSLEPRPLPDTGSKSSAIHTSDDREARSLHF